MILVARTRRKKKENSVSTFGQFCLWASFESSPVSVNSILIIYRTQYQIAIKTSKATWSGTDDSVYINLIGARGQTQFRSLDNKFKNDFEAGKVDKFEIPAVLLGTLYAVELKKSGTDLWNVDWVEVTGELGTSFFPFGKPIGVEKVRANKGVKPQPEPEPEPKPQPKPTQE